MKKIIYILILSITLVSCGKDLQLAQILQKTDNPANAYYIAGNEQYEGGDSEKAIQYYSEGLKLVNPDDFDNQVILYLNRGNAYYSIKKIKDAENDYKKAIRLSAYSTKPNTYSTDANINLGILYSQQGDHKIAADYFTRVLNFDSKNTTANLYLADELAQLDKCDIALKYYSDALTSNVDHSKNDEIYFARGNCKAKIGDYKGAISDYDSAILLNKKAINAVNNRGSVKKKIGDIKGFEEDLKLFNELKKEGYSLTSSGTSI